MIELIIRRKIDEKINEVINKEALDNWTDLLTIVNRIYDDVKKSL